MAILKCNMCGGELDLSTDMSVGVCQYCGSKITIPKDLDHKGNLYNRAVFLRQNNEFDKAALIYEEILKEDNSDAEAHWGLVLSKFGIEYVSNPGTGELHPTCHRTQAESILSDPDYVAALEHYDAESASVIREQANQINVIQSKILEISRKEAPYDIFICYKESDSLGNRTKDSTIAQDLYYELVKRGYKVFFARKTLESKLGTEYEPIIYAALNSARVMIVLGTDPDYFNAVWVRNEWSRFLKMTRDSKNEKIIIPAYKGFSPYELPNELSTFQSQNMDKIGFMQDLTDGIERCLRNKTDKTEEKGGNSGAVDSHQRLIKNGETHLRLQNFETAEGVYNTLVNDYPDDYRGWWGLINCKTKGLTDINCDVNKINVWYKYVSQLATNEQLAEIEKDYIAYLKNVSESEVSVETDNIIKIVAKHREAIAYNQNAIKSLNNSLTTFKEQYKVQAKIDSQNNEKASKNLKTNKSRLIRKIIFVGLFAAMFILSIILFAISIMMIESGDFGGVLIASIGIGLLSFVNLIIAPKGSFKHYSNEIKRWEKHLSDCDSCEKSNAEIYEAGLADYKNKIERANAEINVLRMRIAACNNYLNIGNEKIAEFCFAHKCSVFGKKADFDPVTKELRDLAYGFKEITVSAPDVNQNTSQTAGEEQVIEEQQPAKENAVAEQKYQLQCPYCDAEVIIGSKEYDQGTAFCGVCGAEIKFQK